MSKFNPNIRERVLLEVLATERDYVSDLNIILDVYREPLMTAGLITEEQAQILFANVSDLEDINRTKVLAKIEARFKAVTDAGVPSFMINMGDIFMSLADQLKAYTEYCANQPKALAMLDELEKHNEEFAAFVHTLMVREEVVRGLSLLSFIIKPVQRLCKYPLLLRELINNTDPSLPEHTRLQEAMDKVSATVDYVNQMQRQAEASAAEKMAELQGIEASVEGADQLQLAQDKNRKVARIGDVSRVDKKKKKVVPRKLYGFNNLLMLVAPRKKVKKGETQAFKLDWYVKIADTSVVDLGNSEDGLISNGFELKEKNSSESVILCCSTLQEKNAWVKEIRVHIKEYQKQENMRRKNRLGGTGVGSAPLSESPSRRSTVSSGVRAGGIADEEIPPPPIDDQASDWREKQEQESKDPPGFKRPPRWGDWLAYQHEEHGIPYYYNISTHATTWFQPEGWTPSST